MRREVALRVPPSHVQVASSVEPDALRWLGFAVIALALSGVLSIILVLGRIPGLAPALIRDVDFARRCLVVHVNLAVGVWFFAFLAGLFYLLPGPPRRNTISIALSITLIGVVACAISMWFPSATPVLSNYVPVLDSHLFVVGLALCAVGISASLVDRRLISKSVEPSLIPPDAAYGLRFSAVTFLAAMTTIVVAYLTRDRHGATLAVYERLFWGGGHVLQISATMAMLAGWSILLNRETGRVVMSGRLAVIVFGAMLVPALAAPFLTLDASPNPVFTRLMEIGLAPAVGVVIWSGIALLVRERKASLRRWSPALVGLSTSVVMTLVGFVFGAGITTDTTLTPAHYHMNIGAVTVCFMSVLLTLLPTLGAPLRWPRLATWQPLIYGVGQGLFATGLGIAGFWGQAARKIYGPEQPGGPGAERNGLILAGIGGTLALVGGVMFIVIVYGTWRRRHDTITAADAGCSAIPS